MCRRLQTRRFRQESGSVEEVFLCDRTQGGLKSGKNTQEGNGNMSSCRKRCKREILKFAQYLFRLITGTLHAGESVTSFKEKETVSKGSSNAGGLV
ncbi:putative Kv channel-interacting protein 4 [Triplophysa rosa]|uniref:Kv channel-interacting protein 4 n=1 Tax=Triplophysa rosa TaxID=992332 RepID=A0A9W7X4A1_TRIRA|nr:putative Kv channel-interacting protein 4 [Triplophysa rosa]